MSNGVVSSKVQPPSVPALARERIAAHLSLLWKSPARPDRRAGGIRQDDRDGDAGLLGRGARRVVPRGGMGRRRGVPAPAPRSFAAARRSEPCVARGPRSAMLPRRWRHRSPVRRCWSSTTCTPSRARRPRRCSSASSSTPRRRSPCWWRAEASPASTSRVCAWSDASWSSASTISDSGRGRSSSSSASSTRSHSARTSSPSWRGGPTAGRPGCTSSTSPRATAAATNAAACSALSDRARG